MVLRAVIFLPADRTRNPQNPPIGVFLRILCILCTSLKDEIGEELFGRGFELSPGIRNGRCSLLLPILFIYVYVHMVCLLIAPSLGHYL
jgi:hypothetical protein